MINSSSVSVITSLKAETICRSGAFRFVLTQSSKEWMKRADLGVNFQQDKDATPANLQQNG